MCKIYDAIYKLAEHVESDVLICVLPHVIIEGSLHRCNCNFDLDKCYDGIVTLKDAKLIFNETKETKDYKWINISSKNILSFAFKCCEIKP